MAATLAKSIPPGNPFEERVMEKLESIESRLSRLQGRPPPPEPLPPPDLEQELAGLRAYYARREARHADA